MPITGAVEQAGQFGIHGWLSRDTPAEFAPSLDIVVNRRLAATVYGVQIEPSQYRFSFNPFESLTPGLNLVETFVSGTDQLIEGGVFSIDLQPVPEALSSDGQIFEHSYPSVAVTLSRMYRQAKPGGVAVLDFLCAEPEMVSSYASFAEDGTFTRVYSESEMRAFALDAGFEVLELRQSAGNRAHLTVRKPEVSL